MSSTPRTQPRAIVPPLPAPLDPCPVATYIASLRSPRSRETMAWAAAKLASQALFAGVMPASPSRVHWGAFGRAEVVALIRRLDHLCPSTHALCISALRGILRAAGVAPEVVATAKHTKASRLPAGRALSILELRRLKRAALGKVGRGRTEAARLRDAALIVLMAEGGLRVSEVCNALASSWTIHEDGTGTLRVIGKGSRERAVPFAQADALIVSTYIDGRREGRLITRYKGLGKGEPMTPEAVRHVLRTLAKRAGVDRCAPHDLRRAAATILDASGVNLTGIAAFLGHSSTTTTALYVRPQKLEIARSAARKRAKFLADHIELEGAAP